MILKVTLADQLLELNVPDEFLAQAADFFDKMDADMDRGWQVNREWFDKPDPYLRGQIAADKLLTALENEDYKLGRMMAGYIAARFPQIERVELSEQGETRDHELKMQAGAESAPAIPSLGFSHQGLPQGLSLDEALAQASKDVSSVFKMGRQYRFSVYNHATGSWEESPAFGSQADAEATREAVFRQRLEAFGGMAV
jgi:hypothetical protein